MGKEAEGPYLETTVLHIGDPKDSAKKIVGLTDTSSECHGTKLTDWSQLPFYTPVANTLREKSG